MDTTWTHGNNLQDEQHADMLLYMQITTWALELAWDKLLQHRMTNHFSVQKVGSVSSLQKSKSSVVYQWYDGDDGIAG